VSEVVRSVDANSCIDVIVPLDRLMSSSVARPRFYAVLFGLFVAVAAMLAAIGIYGVLAHTVSLRTQEIGVRIALGAERPQVLALILRHGAALAIVGLALGLAGASLAARVLQSMLFDVRPLDWTTFIVVPMMFGFVALLASYVPARRATRVDPIVALRRE
jgi:putative ABC transport system permease protein